MSGAGSTPPALAVRGATKRFGAVLALDAVDVEVRRGEVLALLGDNGAGKSTLIKCLTGAMEPNAGTISLDGSPVHFKRPQDARDSGIETVYQTLAVAPALEIASNMYLGRERRRRGPLASKHGSAAAAAGRAPGPYPSAMAAQRPVTCVVPLPYLPRATPRHHRARTAR